jgi:hypothetical protein
VFLQPNGAKKENMAGTFGIFSLFDVFRGPNFLLQFLGFLASFSVFGG